MRLRITQRLDGSIDGIQLDQFVTGQIYEVGTGLGSYLLSIEAAEPASDDAAATRLSFDQQLFKAGQGPWPVVRVHDRDPKDKRKIRGR
jgi:hypothetical protein